MNKKAQGLSTNAIILIVLGVIVLVILAIGFLAGWDRIAPWIKPSNNVKTIVDACSMACSMNSVYDYCSVKRELKAEDETLNDVTCYYLSEKELTYGVSKCSSICEATVTLDVCKAEDKDKKTSQILKEDTKTLVHTPCK